MNIGDKVKIKQTDILGYIVEFINLKLVKIKVESLFFEIPKQDLVLVGDTLKKEENTNDLTKASFKNSQINKPKTITKFPNLCIQKKILALVYEKTSEENFYILNNTLYPVLISLFYVENNLFKPIYYGLLKPKTYQKLSPNLKLVKKQKLIAHYFFIFEKSNILPTLQKKTITLLINKLKQSNKLTIPLLNRQGYIFELSENKSETELAKNLQKIWLEGKANTKKSIYNVKKPNDIVDLHIEKLEKEYQFLSVSEIKDIQIEVFKTKLAEAISTSMKEISFIHGIGNQILSKEIHDYLKDHKDVKNFEIYDASNILNRGITLVKLN